MVPKSHFGSLLKGILIPWNLAIFSATSAEMLGSLSSHVSSLRLCQKRICFLRKRLLNGTCALFPKIYDEVKQLEVSNGASEDTLNKPMATYWDVLLQSSLRENPIEFRSKLSFCQNGKHYTLQHHCLCPLKTHNQQDNILKRDCFDQFFSEWGSSRVFNSSTVRTPQHSSRNVEDINLISVHESNLKNPHSCSNWECETCQNKF